jgi:hypothetical protein|tara:strand:- start:453 stop:599 length:147 start_codon:yes stop_codon:yes gene_type:complete
LTSKSFTRKDKKGREEKWEWEETPEVTAALERLHKDIKIRMEESNNDS